MRNAIILHGSPSKEEYYHPTARSESNSHWLPWLQSQLIKKDVLAVTPEIPHPYIKDWDIWKREVERFDIGKDTIFVGHSTGAGFFVKYLSLRKNLIVDKVILVAPFLDPNKKVITGFFENFTIDTNLTERTQGVHIFNSDNDRPEILASVKLLQNSIKNIKTKEFHNYGHFCFGDMKTEEFPELLDAVLS